MNVDITSSDGLFDWVFKGVDFSIPGNGGIDCRDFLSLSQRCIESVAASVIALLALGYAVPRLKLPELCSCKHHEPLGKRILLLLMCLTFGIELGFKFATCQMIWIGNPCHVVTMVQIFILAAPPSKAVTAVFRLHMHMLAGAPIAILFPVINTRLLPFEIGVYFIQHILMLVIPFYLLYVGDPFIPEPLGDFKWALTSLGILFIYHFVPLQIFSYMTHVNLNNMLCPAVSDPFHGPLYRVFAICHQFVIILTLGKGVVIIARFFRIMPHDVFHICSCKFKYSSHPSGRCLCEGKRNPTMGSFGDSKAEGGHDQIGTFMMLNKTNKGSNIQARLCHHCGNASSSFGIYSHRNCITDSGELNGNSPNTYDFPTQNIVNGHLVSKSKDDQKGRSLHDIFSKRLPETRDVGKHCQNSNILVRDSDLSKPEIKSDLHKTNLVSQLGKSQNGHAKFN